MPDFDTMPIEEVRDAVARMLGWTLHPSGWHRRNTSKGTQPDHPIPMTLDAVAELMSEGVHVRVQQHSDGWYAWIRYPLEFAGICESQRSTELEARLRCLAKVLSHKEAP